jgi:putative CocE/NonD family hydrolase
MTVAATYRKACGVLLILLLCGCISFTRAQEPAQSSPAQYKVKREFNVRVPMRDGTMLSADIYRPDADGKFPVVLSRSPYNKNSKSTLNRGISFAEQGYVYITQDCRGRYDSEGHFVPLVSEGHDGYDTIEWAASQSWSSGKVGTIGGSYGAWDQWLAAVETPAHLSTMISSVSPPDPFLNIPYQNGAFMLGMVDWMILVDGHTNQDVESIDLPEVYRHLPLIDVDEVAGRHSEWFREWAEHNTYDDYWKKLSYQDKYSRVNVPVLHITGWYDDDQLGGPTNFTGMIAQAGSPEARANQRLLIGAWPHAFNTTQKLGDIDFGPQAIIDMNAVYFRWFDCYLKAKDCEKLQSEAPVRIFVMGENRWRDEHEWPLTRAHVTSYYLHSQGKANTLTGDGTLSADKPAGEPSDHYTYDPHDPTPFLYAPGSFQLGMAEDQRPIEWRPDILVFTSAALDSSVEVTGPIRMKLFAASSAPDTDWVARLIDVHPDGYAQRIQDGIIRARFRESYEQPSPLTPGKVYEYTIDMWNTSNLFLKGHKIRVDIASAGFPKFDRNLNTGKSNEATNEMQAAQQTVLHDSAHASRILLPVVPRP